MQFSWGRPLYRNMVCLCLFGIVTAWTYRNGLIAIPNLDEELFTRERAFASSDFEYFKKVLWLDRNREIPVNSVFLFRPLVNLPHAIMEIFFHSNLYVIGFVSLLLHVGVSVALFQFLALFVFQGWAFFLALLFCIHPANMELILQRHVSFYLLAPLFLLWGLNFLVKYSREEKRSLGWAAFLCFLLAMMAHEFISVTLLVLGLTNRKRVSLLLLSAVFCYLCINIIDWNLHPTEVAFSSFQFQPNFVRPIVQALRVCGLSLYAFVYPLGLAVKQNPSTLDQRWEWDCRGVPDWALLAAGLTLILAMLRSLRYAKERLVSRVFVALFLIYAGVLAVGRMGAPGNEHYLSWGYYYLYFPMLCFFGWIGLVFRNGFRFPWVIQAGIAIYFLISSHQVIQQRTAPVQVANEKLARALLKIQTELNENKHFCYAGFIQGETNFQIPSHLLFRESCAMKPGIPVYALSENGELILKPIESGIPPVELAGYVGPMRQGKFLQMAGGSVHLNFRTDPKRDPSVSVFPGSYSLQEFGIQVPNATNVGMIVGYRDSKNYITLLVYQTHGIGIAKVDQGQVKTVLPPTLLGNINPIHIGFKVFGEDVYLVREGVLYRRLKELSAADLTGQVGVFSADPKTELKSVTAQLRNKSF